MATLRRSSLVLSLVTLAGCTAPGAQDEEPVPLSAASTTSDSKSFAALFRDTSTMRGDPSDWDSCHGKASCAPGERIRGISKIPGDTGRTALCTQGSGFGGQVTATLTLDGHADQRRAQRAVNGDKDWAFGAHKLECGDGEYVSAVSEDAAQCSGSNRFHAVQCAKGSGLSSQGCSTRTFGNGDDRGSQLSGDWDFGAYKGECGDGEYVAGVSVDVSSGAPHSLLCCPGGGGGTPPATALGDMFFGISSDAATWGPDQASTLRRLGAGMVRIQFCDWDTQKENLIQAVKTANAAGLHVLAELNYCTLAHSYPDSASWHQDFTDSGNAFAWAFAAMARDVAKTFAGQGMVYEIWNEPNAAPRPASFDPNKPAQDQWPSADNADWDGSCGGYAYGADHGQDAWALCPRQLGAITVNAYMAIKDADSQAKVVTGNLLFHGPDGWVAKEYWKQVEKCGAVSWYRQNKGGMPWDMIGIHPYYYRPTDGTLDGQIKSFQGIVSSFGDPQPIAITEYGWHTQPSDSLDDQADEATQATYLKATFALAKQRGIAFVDWFNYLDGPITYGVRRAGSACDTAASKGCGAGAQCVPYPGQTAGICMSWKPSGKAYCQAAGATSCPAN